MLDSPVFQSPETLLSTLETTAWSDGRGSAQALQRNLVSKPWLLLTPLHKA